MVTRMLELGADAEPGDATDALAVALCFGCREAAGPPAAGLPRVRRVARSTTHRRLRERGAR
jgi:hypothetical protein